MAVHHIPEGYHSVTPYLVVDGAAEAIEFYKKAFGATELMRMPAPGGKIGHAEIMIGDSHVMLADEHPAEGHVGPKTVGGTPMLLSDTMTSSVAKSGIARAMPPYASIMRVWRRS